MKHRIEQKTDLQLFSLYVWEKQTTEKMFGSYPYPPNLYERNYVEFIAGGGLARLLWAGDRRDPAGHTVDHGH